VDVIALILKLAHIALAMGLVAGMVGRWIVLSRAAAEDRIDRAVELSELAGPFERLVIGSSMLVVPLGLATAWAQGYDWLGLTTFWMVASLVLFVATMLLVPIVFVPRGRRFEAALADARRAGAVTPELRAAFHDGGVRFARIAEVVVLAIIVVLMVVKPTL
jgi:Predicted integral membrane protein (DUF2269)